MLVTCCIKKRSVQNIIELFLYSPVINYGHISAILSPPQTNSRLASLADFFFAHADVLLFFPPMRSLVPG